MLGYPVVGFLISFFLRMKGSVESRCPELLATYCDILLRKSNVSKKLSSEEIDEKLNNVVCLILEFFIRFIEQLCKQTAVQPIQQSHTFPRVSQRSNSENKQVSLAQSETPKGVLKYCNRGEINL